MGVGDIRQPPLTRQIALPGPISGYTLAERLVCPDRYDHTCRKLNGHIPLNLPELHNWVLVLGVHIHPGGPDNISDMLPQANDVEAA